MTMESVTDVRRGPMVPDANPSRLRATVARGLFERTVGGCHCGSSTGSRRDQPRPPGRAGDGDRARCVLAEARA